ncbi:MAG TPA: sigma-54-dependent Fis family transcriptional regulator [Candidatus Latescibacteria bacterium]|nr:sigma-54-dependent Fis family transcriptional regulator [Candidatus Handelsmanbacteria bacterium]HIL09375.1 sigma-54-dependent Fis family transcriptional regulator [Candidatus Latescibacterota bacterium]
MPKQQAEILIADDEIFIREGLQEALQKNGYAIETVADGHQARQLLAERDFHLVILDLRMPGPSGMDLLQEIGRQKSDTQCIILTAHGNVSTAVEAMRMGAYDFLTKPVDLDHLRLMVDRALDRFELVTENRKLHNRLEKDSPFRRLVRLSPAMQAATATIKQVAQSDVPVLLRGETGVGKDLVARSIHERSKRREAPFVAVNCGGFTEELFSSELFGHKRGAFTGAHADRPGRFALAEGGTLFLDEIGEVPIKNQVELLRVLESHEFQPLGDPQVHHANVRIIAATNRDLEGAVASNAFREDLYYRLNVVPIDIPPLRNRQEDIPVLIEMCLDEACRAQDQPPKKVSPEAMECLLAHPWPGNVRELRNLLQRLVVTSSDTVIRPEHLPGSLIDLAAGPGHFSVRIGSSLEMVEAELIRQTLQRVTSNRREAAAILGISVRSLQYKLKQYKISS